MVLRFLSVLALERNKVFYLSLTREGYRYNIDTFDIRPIQTNERENEKLFEKVFKYGRRNAKRVRNLLIKQHIFMKNTMRVIVV